MQTACMFMHTYAGINAHFSAFFHWNYFQEFNKMHLKILHEAKKMFYFRFPPSHWKVNKEGGRGGREWQEKRGGSWNALTEPASFPLSLLPLSSSSWRVCRWAVGAGPHRQTLPRPTVWPWEGPGLRCPTHSCHVLSFVSQPPFNCGRDLGMKRCLGSQ